MQDTYNVTQVVIVDRGMVQVNKAGMLGRHLPYPAGIMIQNIRSGNLEFLDDFNAQILLANMLDFPNEYDYSSLYSILQYKGPMLKELVRFVSVPELAVYLKQAKARKASRNSERMHSLSSRTMLGGLMTYRED